MKIIAQSGVLPKMVKQQAAWSFAKSDPTKESFVPFWGREYLTGFTQLLWDTKHLPPMLLVWLAVHEEINFRADEYCLKLETPVANALPCSAEVQSFIESYPHVKSSLDEAKRQICKYFGNVEVSLQLFKDVDDPDSEELVVYIHTPLTVTEAMNRLDSFFEEWWLDNQEQTKGKMGFDLRFQ